MSVSNTYVFTVSASDIVNAALRSLQVLDQNSTANTTDMTNGIQALNLLLKSIATIGLPVFKVSWLNIPMVAGVYLYALTEGVVAPFRPTRLISAYLKTNSSNEDVTVQIISRQEYEMLGNKTSQGIVNQIYYDNQDQTPALYVYNVPQDNTTTLYVSVQVPIMDINASTDNFDVPQEWFLLLKWMLAEELSLEYSVPPNIVGAVQQKAKHYLDLAMNMSQEEASVYFSIDPQTYYMNRSGV